MMQLNSKSSTLPLVAAGLLLAGASCGQKSSDHASTASDGKITLRTNSPALEYERLQARRKEVDLLAVQLSPSEVNTIDALVAKIISNWTDAKGWQDKLSKLSHRERALSLIESLVTVNLSTGAASPASSAAIISELAIASRTGPLVVNSFGWLLFNSPSNPERDKVIVHTMGELGNRSYLLQIARYHPDDSTAEEAVNVLSKNSPKLAEWLKQDRGTFLERVITIRSRLTQEGRLQASLTEAYLALEDIDVQLRRYEDLTAKLQRDLAVKSEEAEQLRKDAELQRKAAETLQKQLEEQKNRDIVVVGNRRYRLRQLIAESPPINLGSGFMGIFKSFPKALSFSAAGNLPIIAYVPNAEHRDSVFELRSQGVRVKEFKHGTVLPERIPSYCDISKSAIVTVRFYAIESDDGRPVERSSFDPAWSAHLAEQARKAEERERQRRSYSPRQYRN